MPFSMFKLVQTCHFTMDNGELRHLLQKNRNMVETFKKSYERESYADYWLMIKSLEYNQLINEIRD